jgi:hypothetical protein
MPNVHSVRLRQVKYQIKQQIYFHPRQVAGEVHCLSGFRELDRK